MAFSAVPRISSGAKLSSRPRISAPISRNGPTMRFMGRFCSESSPVSLVVNFCPARIPANNRIVVPEFPASSARQLLFSPRAPRPVILTESFSIFTSAPNAFMHASGWWQSTPAAKCRSSLVPSASPASMAYRCEMDLSPGGSTPPVTALAGCIVSFFTHKFYHAHSTIPRIPSRPRLLFRHQQYRSSRPEQAGAFSFLLRSCEAAGLRSGGISLRFSSPSKHNSKATPTQNKNGSEHRRDLGSLSATGNTGHPDRSRPAHLLFCFPPAKQPACEVEGSLFAFLRRQNTIRRQHRRKTKTALSTVATLAPLPQPATPVIPTGAGRRICCSASLLRSSRPAKWRDLSSLFFAVKTQFEGNTDAKQKRL